MDVWVSETGAPLHCAAVYEPVDASLQQRRCLYLRNGSKRCGEH